MTPIALETAASYYKASPGTRWFRWLLGTTERLSPALAARAATRLFLTPLPPKWLQRRHPWAAQWQVETWGFEDASLTLYSRPAAPHGPVVLLVHGWGGHAGQLRELAAAVSARGLRPVLLELPAHGRSQGATSNLPQFARAIDYVAARLRQQGHELRAVVAHSLAANALAYAAGRGLDVPRLVLLAPPASPYEYTQLFAHVFGLGESTRAALQHRVEAREGILMRQFEPASSGARVRVPTLVVHDREDRINPFADGLAFSQAIPGARLLETSGLGHVRVLRAPQVLDAVVAHVK
ncbi:alpha/beta hydrolase [Hydrogenophaga sp. OTU3427]|uniref:alpha/beta hydrolase n=1 Tax=Hydrogenophaga sp. OTU3427 TaxID=3043856 RepID=UPI00313B0342